MSSQDEWIRRHIGKQVIADLGDHFLIIGTLDNASADHLSFIEADLHDHREANSSKEIYAIETVKFGVRVNRKRVDVPRHRLVAISLLDEIAS